MASADRRPGLAVCRPIRVLSMGFVLVGFLFVAGFAQASVQTRPHLSPMQARQAAAEAELGGAQEASLIRLRSVHGYEEAGQFFIDAQFSMRLTDAAREALENGIPLVFQVDAAIYRGRDMFWDERLSGAREEITLRFNQFTRRYLVSRMISSRFGRYHSLANALAAIGDIQAMAVGSSALVNRSPDPEGAATSPPGRREGRLRLRLMHERLPSPLQLPAIFDAQWQIDSGWQDWLIQAPS